jgi:hypothetical protein
MGNTVASGDGYSFEVGTNCKKFTEFTSDVVLTLEDLFIYKIAYNNSKYGKACLAGTQTYNGIILAQNKHFNFQWEVLENEDTGEFFIFGNHTKKCEKNSLAIIEVMLVEPVVLQANHAKFTAVAHKFKNNSELAAQIKKLRK